MASDGGFFSKIDAIVGLYGVNKRITGSIARNRPIRISQRKIKNMSVNACVANGNLDGLTGINRLIVWEDNVFAVHQHKSESKLKNVAAIFAKEVSQITFRV